MKMPNFFVLGAPKTGTTAMAHYLSDHPQVFMCEPKEPHHYNSDLNYGWYKDADAYATLFENAGEEHRAVGEASVWYLYSKTAVSEILAEVSDAKFIVMLRNPTEMAPSLHEQMLFSGGENLQSFQEAWRAQSQRRQGRNIPLACKEPKFLLYKDACSLGTQLQRVFSKIDHRKLLVVFNDDFRPDPAKIWNEVQQFLGVDSDGRLEFPAVNVAKERRSQLLASLSATYSAARHRFNIPPLGSGSLTYLDKKNTRKRARAPLAPELRAALDEAFAGEVDLLAELTGRDLSHWKKMSAAPAFN